jgi:hypothetical protein
MALLNVSSDVFIEFYRKQHYFNIICIVWATKEKNVAKLRIFKHTVTVNLRYSGTFVRNRIKTMKRLGQNNQ